MHEYENHNPDVLSCLASLSNDEVFTPPFIANQMLDLLPTELWSNPNVKFLDPCCKSGVFLREIVKRLIVGLEPIFPDLQERVNHICKNQVFGIAITELTALLSRRSLYCSKHASGEYSIYSGDFKEQGNINFESMKHVWSGSNCIYCGANKASFDRPDDLESHAYKFIHVSNPAELFGMKFDVIIGNPPYQLETGGSGRQAKPIYNLFVEQAKKMNPQHLVMIIPSRWFAGGMGLDKFRDQMLSDNHIKKIVDYTNAKDCFPSSSVSGGVCYFHWDRNYDGFCDVVNIRNGVTTESNRPLNEFSTLIRYNEAVDIVRKVVSLREQSLSSIISSISPFAIVTKVRGASNRSPDNSITLHSSAGISFIPLKEVLKGHEYLKKFKVMISQTSAEHAGEPRKDGKFGVISGSMKVIGPDEVCTHSYLVAGPSDDEKYCTNLCEYLKTKFVRFLVLQSLTSIHLTKDTFSFVPVQDFTKQWKDEDLFSKYNLNADQIDFIDNMIKSFGKDEDACDEQ